MIYIEIIDQDGNPLSNGNEGEVVVTDLRNRAMPLIRYKTGDLAVIDNNRCSCRWKNLSILKRLFGRKEDSFILPSGETLPSGLLIGALGVENPRSIMQWKVIQKRLDKVVIYIVKGNEFHIDDEKRLISKLVKLFNNNLSVSVQYIILDESSRKKHKVFECQISPNFIEQDEKPFSK